MKKILAVIGLLICFATTNAQPPHIIQFRQILESAKTNFAGDIGEVVSKDKANNIYKPKVPTDMGESFVMESLSDEGKVTDRNYIISFKKKLSDDKDIQIVNDSRFSIYGFVARGYLTEMTEQVKAGTYSSKENYEKDGKTITDWYTKENALAVRYAVDENSKIIIVYKHTK